MAILRQWCFHFQLYCFILLVVWEDLALEILAFESMQATFAWQRFLSIKQARRVGRSIAGACRIFWTSFAYCGLWWFVMAWGENVQSIFMCIFVRNKMQQRSTHFFLEERIRWPWNRRNARFLADLSELIAPKKTENALQQCCMPKMYCTYYDCTIEACSWSILRGVHHLGTREDKLQLLHQAKASGDERKLRQALEQATSETSWQVPAAQSFRFLQRKL